MSIFSNSIRQFAIVSKMPRQQVGLMLKIVSSEVYRWKRLNLLVKECHLNDDDDARLNVGARS